MRFIGNKSLLLEEIKNFIDTNVKNDNNLIFCDIFSGSVSVARYFKKYYNILSNDNLYFSYILQKATIEINHLPKFQNLNFLKKNSLKGIIDYFENESLEDIQKEYEISDEELFIYNNYTPKNSSRMYFTLEIGKRIDLIRIIIRKWFENNFIDENEYIYLIALLIETAPFYSNISGVYGAFLKHWDKRALKPFKFTTLNVHNNGTKNISYNVDAHELIRKISGDVLYLDPPYNHRQYPPNYHILETIAKYDYPEIKGVSGMRDYSNQISHFCRKKEVKNALADIIEQANFKYIIMSYSTDGILTIDEIEEVFKKFGKKDTFLMAQPIKYRKYKSKQKQKKKNLHELLFFIEKKDIKENPEKNKIKQELKVSSSEIINTQTKLTDLYTNGVSK